MLKCLQVLRYKRKRANGDVRGASGRPNWPHESMYPTPSVLQLVPVETDDFAIPRVDVGKGIGKLVILHWFCFCKRGICKIVKTWFVANLRFRNRFQLKLEIPHMVAFHVF